MSGNLLYSNTDSHSNKFHCSLLRHLDRLLCLHVLSYWLLYHTDLFIHLLIDLVLEQSQVFVDVHVLVSTHLEELLYLLHLDVGLSRLRHHFLELFLQVRDLWLLHVRVVLLQRLSHVLRVFN